MTRSLFARVLLAVVLLVGSASVAHTQGRDPDLNAEPYAALVAEMQKLRQAIEAATRVQSQIQGLAVHIAAQQSRLVQVSARLDTVRGELRHASARAREITRLFTSAQDEIAASAPGEAREEAVDISRIFKDQSGGDAGPAADR